MKDIYLDFDEKVRELYLLRKTQVGNIVFIKGDKGDTGPIGERGDKGPKGAKGLQGVNVTKGDKGDQGDQGDNGPKGPKGTKGPKGIKGITGVKGDPGDIGDKGDLGIPGTQGEKGDTGEKGDPGYNSSQYRVVQEFEIINPTDIYLYFFQLAVGALNNVQGLFKFVDYDDSTGNKTITDVPNMQLSVVSRGYSLTDQPFFSSIATGSTPSQNVLVRLSQVLRGATGTLLLADSQTSQWQGISYYLSFGEPINYPINSYEIGEDLLVIAWARIRCPNNSISSQQILEGALCVEAARIGELAQFITEYFKPLKGGVYN